jgi:diguanylate cyclase (GGDEF)-like protein/PAS domain S-box-containing protein
VSDTLVQRLSKQAEAALRESNARYDELVRRIPVGVYTIRIDADGAIGFQYVSEKFCRMLGLNEQDVLRDAESVHGCVHPDDRASLDEANRLAAQTLQPFRWEGRSRLCGETRWIRVESEPTVLPNGGSLWNGVMIDITARKQAEENFRIALHRLDTLISSLYAGVLLVSNDGRVEFANQAFCDLFDLTDTPAELHGLTPDEMLKKIQRVYISPADALARIQDLVARRQPVKGEELALQGGRFYIRDFIPIFIDGQHYGRLWNHVDITERKQAEAALAYANSALEEAQQLAKVGSWDWDIANDTTTWSTELYRIFGRDPRLPPPTDRERLQIYTAEGTARLDAAVTRTIADGTRYEVDLEILRPDGSRGWIVSRGEPQYDAQRRIVRLRGTCSDVTERHLMEEALRLSLAEVRRNNLQMIDLNRMVDLLLVSETRQEAHGIVAERIGALFDGYTGGLAVQEEHAPGLRVIAAWGAAPSLLPRFWLSDCWALRRGEPFVATDPAHGIQCRHFATPPRHAYLCVPLAVRGETLGLLHLSAPGMHSQGAIREGLGLAVRVSESLKLALSNLTLREALRKQAIYDSLTGLFNRHYLDETLRLALRHRWLSGEPLVVAMLDLDRFKRFNDDYSHEAGDVVLRAVGELLRGTLRASDLACRYGGEEFTVVMPDSTLNDARIRLDTLRQAVMQLHLGYQDRDLPAITVSIGVAAAQPKETDIAALLGRADAALYQAKKEGRNRVVVAA